MRLKWKLLANACVHVEWQTANAFQIPSLAEYHIWLGNKGCTNKWNVPITESNNSTRTAHVKNMKHAWEYIQRYSSINHLWCTEEIVDSCFTLIGNKEISVLQSNITGHVLLHTYINIFLPVHMMDVPRWGLLCLKGAIRPHTEKVYLQRLNECFRIMSVIWRIGTRQNDHWSRT